MKLSVIRSKFDVSLGKKFVISILIFFILPLGFAALLINSKVSSTIMDSTCQTDLAVLKQPSLSLSRLLNDTKYVSLDLITNTNVESLIKYANENNAVEVAKESLNIFRIKNDFGNLFDSRYYINSVSIYKDKDIYLQYRELVKNEDNQFDEEVSLLKGKAFWTPVYNLPNRLLNNDSPMYVVSLIRAVISTDKFKQIATVRLSIDENEICKIYKDFGTDGNIFIIDSSGKVISSADKKMLMKDLNSESYINTVLKNSEGYYKTIRNNLESRVIYCKIKEANWYLVWVIPEYEMKKQVAVINVFITVCISFCLLFVLLFLFIQNKTVIQPLKLLSAEMEKVKKGDFNITLGIKNKDEIGKVTYIFVEMIGRIKELIDNVYRSRLMEKESRLAVLESQINPHFLYNTLDSIRWSVISKGEYESGEQIKALSDIFRHVLNEGREITKIRNEVVYLKSYMLIQKYRFEDKISMEINADESLMDCSTIKLILQPLVENSIRHGLECKMGAGKIIVSIARSGDKIRYCVEDDGLGADEEQIKKMILGMDESRSVFALRNIHDRVQLKYGSEYGLIFHSKPGQGTKVEVYIPLTDTEGGQP